MQAIKTFLCIVLAVGEAVGSWADNPPSSLFSVNGKSVSADEFTRYVRQSEPQNEEAVRLCLERYIDFRLKVEDALSARMDTLVQFRQQCAVLQGEVLKNYLLSEEQMDRACDEMYRKRSERLLSDTWVELTCLTLPLRQHASRAEVQQAEERMKGLYEVLQAGTSLSAVSAEDSGGLTVQDHVWRPMRGMLKEFSERVEQLKDGEVTVPFFSPLGIHLVVVHNRREGISEEAARHFWNEHWAAAGNLHPALDSLRLRKWKDGRLADPALYRQLQEVREGLLATYWDLQHTDNTASVPVADKSVLADFFEHHRKEYYWDLPHYKGAVVQCAGKKVAAKIRKRLKKRPLTDWAEEMRHLQAEHPEWEARMECGLFRIGQNAFVDKMAFHCGELPLAAGAPSYTFIMGKRLDNGPDDYRDVLSQLQADYRQWYVSSRLQRLKDKYRVEIHEDVLKTVNCGRKE